MIILNLTHSLALQKKEQEERYKGFVDIHFLILKVDPEIRKISKLDQSVNKAFLYLDKLMG